MELQKITEEILAQISRLNVAQNVLYKQAKDKAESERVYRMDLAQEILRLRAEGHPVAIVGDLARGSCANEKFNRDFAEAKFKATIEAIQAIQVSISALQSILKYQSDN